MMMNRTSRALKYVDHQLLVLDQRQLPKQESWIVCQSPAQMAALIEALAVRGAPLIGIAAVLALADFVIKGATIEMMVSAAKQLRAARPTAVNLMNCIDRLLTKVLEQPNEETVIAQALAMFDEDVELCAKMAEHGAALCSDNEHIMTICNTGGLATVGCGTAFGVIERAYQQQKVTQAYVLETRPLLQGGRLTTWECEQAGIPYVLLTDNMIASLMRTQKIDRIFVGADRIVANGDTANKIGTYQLALLAKHFDIPFYVVAPYTTFDLQSKTGHEISIEQRSSAEVKGFNAEWGTVQWAPEQSRVYNPAFDVTPAELITGYITERGHIPVLSESACF